MAQLLKAKEAADLVYENVGQCVRRYQEQGIQPHLCTLLVEGDPASAYYAQAKCKLAEKLGVTFSLHTFPREVTQAELTKLIVQWNEDPGVHGILLELPLPPNLSAGALERVISPEKDVDGVTPTNKLATVTGSPGLYPATPEACLRLLKHYGYRLEGKNVTLIGRGQTVGLPLFHMLQREQATITLCHSRTPDIAFHLRHADIAFVAVGRPGVVTKGIVHPKLVVIDAGINETDDGAIVGDAAEDVREAVSAVSPVPGGVGTLTTAILFENLMKAIALQADAKEAGR
ncbi:bifunctional 5,10-methylene-tetrahydrofolate dehydrogenase/5,10-methylene-tetrahydrofolate cyclohydrolase [Paenibacillus filicis]|uniref:Bifunctional protein FolD n=1 Tax=Paenibacillus gyeongsangnamensis TaxID=3388067 RepID=A0ABT4Q6U7_9BACL|nr:tetrahydrofolate dehydrogenase/cyclohydrolase catalytic domain-containing protein [Paenibacillus filicis]MCZ8512598.1 bifunctional 5,10-methylene-tetrahydrofolate dehydrogenase/5,10-methylene-tetrahydrofolate cyclohydrolase [Paenibacillus filicis]